MHKGRKHTKRQRKTKKGGFYSFSGSVNDSGSGAAYTRGSEMGDWAISSRGGNTQYGRGRKHKKSKKTMKKRGGGKYGGVSASFEGKGSAGMADYKGVITRDGSGSAAGGAFNNHGAQPGSGFGSFVKV